MLRPATFLTLCLGLVIGTGCTGKPAPPVATTDVPAPAANPSPNGDVPTSKEITPSATVTGDEMLSQAKAALAAGKSAEARAAVDALRQLENLAEESRAQLVTLETELAALTECENEAERVAALKKVSQLIANGQLDDAGAAIEVAAARQPTDEQRDQITEYRQQIERIRGAQRKLGAWMKMMSSGSRSDLRAAQKALLEEPEAALPLLIEAIREPGEKQRTINILETLRLLRKPQATLPVMVNVLRQTEQRDCWPEVVEILGKIPEEGAGPLLLTLINSSQDAQQRALALTALTRASDAPAETLFSLLPKLFQDDAELSPTLFCVAQAVRRHDQTDLIALHGFDAGVTPEQSQQLAGLPARLEALQSSANAEVAKASRLVAVSLGLMTPAPLTNIQVLNVSGEYPDSPGKMVLDGVWNSADLTKQWYHPLGPDSQIVFDLGEEKTITGVVIWNFNQAGGATRGWKRAEIFVSPTPTALTPVATGMIPMAPGANDAADYSTLVPVPAATGRYVKLKARELWAPNAYTGLAEVQILGF